MLRSEDRRASTRAPCRATTVLRSARAARFTLCSRLRCHRSCRGGNRSIVRVPQARRLSSPAPRQPLRRGSPAPFSAPPGARSPPSRTPGTGRTRTGDCSARTCPAPPPRADGRTRHHQAASHTHSERHFTRGGEENKLRACRMRNQPNALDLAVVVVGVIWELPLAVGALVDSGDAAEGEQTRVAAVLLVSLRAPEPESRPRHHPEDTDAHLSIQARVSAAAPSPAPRLHEEVVGVVRQPAQRRAPHLPAARAADRSPGAVLVAAHDPKRLRPSPLLLPALARRRLLLLP